MREYVMVVGSGMMGSGIGAMSALAGRRTGKSRGPKGS